MRRSNKTFVTIRVFLGDRYPGVYLTRRESEYVLGLLQGKKRREIAAQLQLSVRTLDFYVKSIKIKIGCWRALEIVGIIKKTDFMRNANDLLHRHRLR